MIDHVLHESNSFVEVHWTRFIVNYYDTRFYSEHDNSLIWYFHIMSHLLLLLREVTYNSRQFY